MVGQETWPSRSVPTPAPAAGAAGSSRAAAPAQSCACADPWAAFSHPSRQVGGAGRGKGRGSGAGCQAEGLRLDFFREGAGLQWGAGGELFVVCSRGPR